MNASWGIVTTAQLRRERKRAEILHGILLDLEAAGHLKNKSMAFRLCRANLRAKKLTMTCRNFSRLAIKWQAAPTPATLVRQRKTVVPYSVFDCHRVAEFAFQKKISLARAVKELKAAGERRVPARVTVLSRLPWAEAVDTYAFSYSRIQRGMADFPPELCGEGK